jgi:NAD(P)-dependent dehydrogenase (short-subunit alcohol dehydrogenase family)
MKTVLITGGNRGIGFEIARQLGAAGFHVYIGARSEEAGTQAVEKLQKENMQASFLLIDVSDRKSVFSAAEVFALKEKTLDVLINNAGIMLDHGTALSLTQDVLEKTFATNTFGPVSVIQAFLPFLKEGSRIINVSSGLGSLTEMGEYSAAYSISKTALNAVTRQFAASLKSKGIAVNSVCPGWVKTELGGASAPREIPKGAETPVWLATEAPITLTGKYLRDKQELPW